MVLTTRVQNLSPSPTLAIPEKVGQLRYKGIYVTNFAEGEPDFNTPDNIKLAGLKAILDNKTKYTPAAGVLELREAICKKLKSDNNLDYSPENIVVTTGAKQALLNSILALVQSDDEVIIPKPCWVSYTEQIKLASSNPVLIETKPENNFHLDLKIIRETISKKTKMIILNSPNNPTGTVYTREELEELANLAVENNIYVLSDEIYEKLLYDGAEHISIASFNNDIKELTIVINGVSKSYAMTGWRLGYSAAAKEITQAMIKIQGHSTSNANSVAQMAALEALSGSQDSVIDMCDEFKKRREFVVGSLKSIEGIKCNSPTGAFYAFPNIESYFGKQYKNYTINTSFNMVEYLLDEAHVAVVQGSAFNAEGYIRICFAASMDELVEGMERVKNALSILE